MQEELGPQEPQNVQPQPSAEYGALPLTEGEVAPLAESPVESEVMNQAAASAKKLVEDNNAKGFSTRVKVAAGAAGFTAAVAGAGLAYNATQNNGPERNTPVATATPDMADTASPSTTEIPLTAPTDTRTTPTEATHTIVIKSPVAPRSTAKTEQTHNTSPAPSASKSPETQHVDFEAQLDGYVQAVGKNGESLSGQQDWTKSVNGNMVTFTRPASVENNDTVNGEYKLLLVHDAAGHITEARWQTLAVSKDQQRTQVLDSFDLAKDGGWVGTATHYTGNGSNVQSYKGAQWNKDTVQTFEEKMDNVGNNATTNPPKPLVYPS
jgi:hypothetical protein